MFCRLRKGLRQRRQGNLLEDYRELWDPAKACQNGQGNAGQTGWFYVVLCEIGLQYVGVLVLACNRLDHEKNARG